MKSNQTWIVFTCSMIQQELKNELNKEKLSYEEYQDTDSPLNKIIHRAINNSTHDIRKDANKEEFEEIAQVILKICVPDIVWRRNYLNLPLSKFITVADEAFALVCLENNVDEWIQNMFYKNERTTKKGMLTKWTGLKGGEKLGGNKTRGWNVDGMRRYNDIYLSIKKLRKTKKSMTLETELLAKLKRNEGAVGSGNTDDMNSDDEEERRKADRKFKPVSGFEDEDEDEDEDE